MKAFVSVDLEGMPYIVNVEQLSINRKLFNEARKIMTLIVKKACEYLHEYGFNDIVVADSHGHMVNIEFIELPEYVELIRGYPRALSMITGSVECDAALMLGYHAKSGTEYSTFDHTYSSAIIDQVKLNDIEVSEFLLNAYALGYYDIPVILVAGDTKLIEEAKRYTPWAKTVTFKESYSRYSAKSPSLKRILKTLNNAIKNAVESFKAGRVKPLKLNGNVKLIVRFKSSAYADAAELIPGIKRINGVTVMYNANNIIEAYKVLELTVLASHGVRSIISSSLIN